MLSTTRLAVMALMGLTLALGACDEQYQDFDDALDTTVPIDPDSANTWMMTTEESTFFLTLETLEETNDSGFILWRLNMDTSATTFTGRYSFHGEELSLRADTQFDVPNEEGIAAAARQGTVRTFHDPPIVFEAELLEVGRTLTIRENSGDERDWYHIGDIYSQLDLTEADDQEMFIRFYTLTESVGTTRVASWGGAGMFQYIGKPADFLGLLNGRFTLDMSGLLNILTEVVFKDRYIDLGGISLNGTQSTTADTAGNGRVSGAVSFVMNPELDDVEPFRGVVTYDLEVIRADLGGGGYDVEMEDGMKFSVPYTATTTMDFRSVVAPQ